MRPRSRHVIRRCRQMQDDSLQITFLSALIKVTGQPPEPVDKDVVRREVRLCHRRLVGLEGLAEVARLVDRHDCVGGLPHQPVKVVQEGVVVGDPGRA